MAFDSASETVSLSTPVAFFVFNRPELTRQVFASIKVAHPSLLLVIADGPRSDRPDDGPLCNEVRQSILDGINWACEVRTLFSDINLGCGQRIYSGLQWVFQQVEEAIILEDDCLPHPTFFKFCQQMLADFRDAPDIFMVAGTHFGGAQPDQANRCLFTRHCSVWGWATWRRALEGYTLDMSWWRGQIQPTNIRAECADWREHRFICDLFDAPRHGAVNTWDIQWFSHVFRQRGLSIVPGTNLVSNLGISGQHTSKATAGHYLTCSAAHFPVLAPAQIIRDREYERLLVRCHRPPGGWFWGHYITKILHSHWGPWLRRTWRRLRPAYQTITHPHF